MRRKMMMMRRKMMMRKKRMRKKTRTKKRKWRMKTRGATKWARTAKVTKVNGTRWADDVLIGGAILCRS